MAEQKNTSVKKHKLTLDNRKRLTATGVLKVNFCSGERIAAQTEIGQLNIRGRDLHIENLSSDELLISGTTDAISYTETGDSDSFLRKLFK